MNEDALNIQIRKFLKKTGIASQRAIEQAVREGIEAGTIKVGDNLETTMTLSIRKIGLDLDIADSLVIEE